MNVSQVPQSSELLAADGKSASQTTLHLFNDLKFAALWLWASGTTAARPTNPALGQLYYDTTLGYIVECTAVGSPTTGTPATWAQLVPPVTQNYVSLFDHFADASTSGTGVTTLYSDTIAAGQLATNGDKLQGWYDGTTTVTNTGNREWFLSFGGTTIFDSGALGTSQNASWRMQFEIIRASSSAVRCGVEFALVRNAAVVQGPNVVYTTVTGLTLTNTQVLLLQGQASVATNDITARMGNVAYILHS